MKLYKLISGIVVQNEDRFYRLPATDWDTLINQDDLYYHIQEWLEAGTLERIEQIDPSTIQKPMGSQELWACGVTYLRSKQGRQEESQASGGSDFYARVYDAERPEVFFKATSGRVVSPFRPVRIRKDSSWNVPEPELTLVVTSSGTIIGYTIGNDMSSRSIEGENPLYLPQAKTYDGCASLGPCVYLSAAPLDGSTRIRMRIHRKNEVVFSGEVRLDQMKRSLEELVSFVYRECSFPNGCLVMTGTGIVPGNDFTLQSNDVIEITIDPIGTLVNPVL